jgi:hypothetical protein
MIKVFLLLLLFVVIAVILLAVVMIRLVKSRDRERTVPLKPGIEAIEATSAKLGTCSKCGEQRVIVSDSEGMCAYCYSSFRTKSV